MKSQFALFESDFEQGGSTPLDTALPAKYVAVGVSVVRVSVV